MSTRSKAIPIFGISLLLLLATGCANLAGSGNSRICADHHREVPCNVVGGFGGNEVSDEVTGATISGGGQTALPNIVLRDFGVVGGGKGNQAGELSSVAGGFSNQASGIRTFIGGGAFNSASRDSAVIGGGYANAATQTYATVSGGIRNTASGPVAVVGGGSGNLAAGRHTTVGGGAGNVAQSAYAAIGGGSYNLASGGTSTIAGGTSNRAVGIGTSIGGGAGNRAAGLQSTIGGGLGNTVTDNYSVVAGGRGNQAGDAVGDEQDAHYAAVGGGFDNQAGGAFSVVPGGHANHAMGDYSLAAGNLSRVLPEHPGTFLFADANAATFSSSNANEFAVRATGGVRFVTALDEQGEPLVGVRLAAGGGAWEALSDRSAKTSIRPVDGQQVLAALSGIPISTWRYQGQDAWHMGPMAQDFRAAFGLGQDDRYIGSLDADGVALAAIQALAQQIKEKDLQMTGLRAEITALENQSTDLETRMSSLETRAVDAGMPSYGYVLLGLSFALGLLVRRVKFMAPPADEGTYNLEIGIAGE